MQTNLAWETLFDVSAQPSGPLHERLARAIRSAIRDGRLPRGAALPPSRTLASDLGVSRWAVTQAYGQLVTEGYLASRTGSATRVVWSPEPDDGRMALRSSVRETPPRYDLNMCSPDYRAFPRRKWVEAIRLAAENTPFDQLDYGDTGGEPRLRAILAEHLSRSRGAVADTATVSVFSGARQGLSQVAHALYAAGHRQIGMEDPGSPGLWPAARNAGLELVPLPVDDDGLVTDALDEHPAMRAVCVGAAHQLMLSCPLAPDRRTALLDWARRVDGLVIEDDYDSEFSYDGPALPVMQGSDLRASRLRFRRRRDALLAALDRRLPGYPVRGTAVGLHLLLGLPGTTDMPALIAAAHRHDMELCDPAELYLRPAPTQSWLPLGYANLNDSLVDDSIALLATLLRNA
jgi:GntR family transcriptional regulator / MocR family aminotransferase